jgi:DNA-binding NtrC family response regulator
VNQSARDAIRELAEQMAHDVLIESHRDLLTVLTNSLLEYAEHLARLLAHGLPEEDGTLIARENYNLDLARNRRAALAAAWRAAEGNKYEAARMLGITPKTVYNWRRELGLTWEEVRSIPVPRIVRSWASIERDLVREALEESKGNKFMAARSLGIDVKTLYRKLSEQA